MLCMVVRKSQEYHLLNQDRHCPWSTVVGRWGFYSQFKGFFVGSPIVKAGFGPDDDGNEICSATFSKMRCKIVLDVPPDLQRGVNVPTIGLLYGLSVRNSLAGLRFRARQMRLDEGDLEELPSPNPDFQRLLEVSEVWNDR